MNTPRRVRSLALLALVVTLLSAANPAHAGGADDPGLKSVVRDTTPKGYAAMPNPSFPDGPLPIDLITSATNTRVSAGMVGFGVQWAKPGSTATIVTMGASTPSAKTADELVAGYVASVSAGNRFQIDIEGARAYDAKLDGSEVTVVAFKRNGRAYMVTASGREARTDAILLAVAIDAEARLLIPRDDLQAEDGTSPLDHLVGIMAGFLLIAALITLVLTIRNRPAAQNAPADAARSATAAPVMPAAPPLAAVSSPPAAGYVEPKPAPPGETGRWTVPMKDS